MLTLRIEALGQERLAWSLGENVKILILRCYVVLAMSSPPIYRGGAAEILVEIWIRGLDRLWVVEPRGGASIVSVLAARRRGPFGRHTGGGALQSVMAPKRNVDKGKAPMVDEEPRGPRTRFGSSTLIIREEREQAREAEDRTTQMGTSSDVYEEEDRLFHGSMPAEGQARTEEIRTKETTGLQPERSEPSGREMTPQVAVGRSNKDRMSMMIDIMVDMMTQLRDVLARQNRAEVERSPPRPHYRVAQEVPPRGSVTPVEEPGRELRGLVMERLDMRAFHEMKPPIFRGERDYRVVNNWIYQMEKIFEYMQRPEEQMVPYATYVLEGNDCERVDKREEEEQDRIGEKRKGTQVGGQSKKPRTGTDRAAPVQNGACYQCGQIGHQKFECPQLWGQIVEQPQ
ncbi:hypothetical protein ACLOJK_014692, partial [Asimina triloba]